jgi:hypothetical protein
MECWKKMEYWNNGIKKQKNQFWCSCNHFQPIIPLFQLSYIPMHKEYHQSLVKSTLRLPLSKGRGLLRVDIERSS